MLRDFVCLGLRFEVIDPEIFYPAELECLKAAKPTVQANKLTTSIPPCAFCEKADKVARMGVAWDQPRLAYGATHLTCIFAAKYLCNACNNHTYAHSPDFIKQLPLALQSRYDYVVPQGPGQSLAYCGDLLGACEGASLDNLQTMYRSIKGAYMGMGGYRRCCARYLGLVQLLKCRAAAAAARAEPISAAAAGTAGAGTAGATAGATGAAGARQWETRWEFLPRTPEISPSARLACLNELDWPEPFQVAIKPQHGKGAGVGLSAGQAIPSSYVLQLLIANEFWTHGKSWMDAAMASVKIGRMMADDAQYKVACRTTRGQDGGTLANIHLIGTVPGGNSISWAASPGAENVKTQVAHLKYAVQGRDVSNVIPSEMPFSLLRELR